MSAAKWKTLPFETAVHSRGSGNAGLPTKQWLPEGQFPVIGQGAEDIEGWTDREDLLLTPTPAVVLYGGHTRRAKHVSQPFVPGPNVKILQPVPAVDSKFLFYFLTQLPVESKGYADHFPLVRKCEIPIPPLAEQRRIVGLLDEALEGLATAKAKAEKNLQNARALFASHLQSVFAQRGPEWVEKKLGEISEFKNGLNYNKSSGGQTLPVVGVADFQDNYFVPLSELQSATIDGDLADNYAIQPNDILTVRSNGSKHLVGRCMLVGDVDEVVSYSGFIIRIRFDAKIIFPQYLLHFMKCQVTRDILTAGGGGANITNINQEKLSTLLVPLPPYKTQIKLAAALDDLREETQRLARLYERKHAALEALKKSLLHQAFTGEL